MNPVIKTALSGVSLKILSLFNSLFLLTLIFHSKSSPIQCMPDLQQHRFFVPQFVPLSSYNSPILPSYH